MAGAVFAADQTNPTDYEVVDGRYPGSAYGTPLTSAKADTVYLIGGPDRNDGKFQDDLSGSIPDLEGWEGFDLNHKEDSQWHVDTFHAELLDTNFTPNHAMWCGEYFEPCVPGDDGAGYGSSYREQIDFVQTVANPAVATEVRLQGIMNYDVEYGWDFLYLQYNTENGMEIIDAFTDSNTDTLGNFVPYVIDYTFTVQPTDYAGASHDQVLIRWLVMSDSATDDSDCGLYTMGAAQIDNLVVSFDGVEVSNENFEGAGPYAWEPTIAVDVGDFAKVWPKLDDVDPCKFNNSPQVAFIDDGVVVPGTGGTLGTTWTYGPGGYTHNLLGGLAGPLNHLSNEVRSPLLEWPAGDYIGATIGFDVFRHCPLYNGLFYVWHIRSTSDGGTTWSPWDDEGYVYYGGPDYLSSSWDVTGLIESDRTHVQIALGVDEIGWAWGFTEIDGTPAPYFDNVRLTTYSYGGPSIFTREIDVAQDDFPARGGVDYVNLGNNSVRFDMANTIAPQADLRNDPGDSIVAEIKLVRGGSELNALPRMYYTLKANPVFDTYRTSGLPNSGYVEGDTCRDDNGLIQPDRWFFDLPDTGFFFPGDIIHYYLWAEDVLPTSETGVSTLPGNLVGYGVFPGDAGYVPLLYDSWFIARALPSVKSSTEGDHPAILFWNDFGDRGGQNEWYTALNSLGKIAGEDFDVFYTHGPSSGVGNGLGGRAIYSDIKDYETMMYTSGDLEKYTISEVDYESDPGDDVGLLDTWLADGKNMLITGDAVVDDLFSYGEGTNFVNNWIQVTLTSYDLRPLIDGQTAPLVLPIAGNTVGLTTEFIAYGGCPILNQFDAVEVAEGAERIAEFADASGAGNVYPYAAGVYSPVGGSQVVYFPVDLMYWYTPEKVNAPFQARTTALQEILLFFGYLPETPVGVEVPNIPFVVNNYPNPFNPSTKIEFNVPKAGKVSVKIYNIKGELVKTLVDKNYDKGTAYTATWNGTDNNNRAMASGVYFAKTKVAGEYTTMNKLTLVK